MLTPEPHRSRHDGYRKNRRDTGVPRTIGIGREVKGRRQDGSTVAVDLAVSQSVHQGQPLFIGLVRDNWVILDIGLPDGSGWQLLPKINTLQSAAQRNGARQAWVESRTSSESLLDTLKQFTDKPAR